MITIAKIYFTTVLAVFALTSYSQNSNHDTTHLYPVSELQADLKFVRKTLESKHPNLYLYTPKEKFDSFFDSLGKCIIEPLSEIQFYNLITLINSKLKDGHTMFLPSDEALSYYNQECKFLPFYIAILNNKCYVNMNCSADTSIQEGSEIISINGVAIRDILRYLLVRQIRDGNNQTYPVWILTNYFKEYFGFSFAHPDKFSIVCKKSDSNIVTATVNALSKDSIKFYRETKYSTRASTYNEKQGIVLRKHKLSGTATLIIKSFSSDVLNSIYNQNFDTTIKELFTQIHKVHIKNLILDIRNNQGGEFGTGKLLLSYLLRERIVYLPDSEEEEMIIPKKNSYKGNLYILVNGGSFSSTGIVSSYLELAKRGIFIGQETAGNKTIISGDPVDTVLPNTKITLEFSTAKYKIKNNSNTKQGVIPAYYTTYIISDIIAGKDLEMQSALQVILKRKNNLFVLTYGGE